MIYLNSPARRAGAPLTTPRQIDEARAAASAALAEARHPETGTPLFPQIVATAEAYGVDPAREGYPDLIALPDESYWVRTKLAPGKGWVEADPNLPGTHRPEGVVALAGAGITPGRTLTADLPDVAPTILKLLGLPDPRHTSKARPSPVSPTCRPLGRTRARTAVVGPHHAAVRVHPRGTGDHRAAPGRPRLLNERPRRPDQIESRRHRVGCHGVSETRPLDDVLDTWVLEKSRVVKLALAAESQEKIERLAPRNGHIVTKTDIDSY